MLLVKALGFVKQMVIAAIFGATLETDLINLSYGLIGNTQYLLVQVLLTGVVSVYISVKNRSNEEAGLFAGDTFKAATLIAGAVCLGIVILATPLAHFLAPSYSQDQIRQLSDYLRWFAPMLLCFAWMGLSHALLNANQRFIPGQLEGLYQSVILIVLSFLIGPLLGANTLAVGYWAYAVVAAAILLIQARNYFAFSRSNPFRNPDIHRLLHMILPLLVGYGAIYINQMVDKILVSGLETGTVSAMSYAAVLYNLIGTLIAALCSVLYDQMTEHIVQGKGEDAARLAERSALLLTILLLPVTVVTVCQAEDLVALVYGRGAFGEREVILTALALAGYGFSFVPLAWKEVYSRIQYGYQDSKRPTRNSVIGIVVNIVLSIALCPYLGVFGVTVASSISTLVIGLLNMITARRDAPELSFVPLLKALPFFAIGTAAASLVCWGCGTWLSAYSVFARLCLSTAAVCAVYGIAVLPVVWKLGLHKLLAARLKK